MNDCFGLQYPNQKYCKPTSRKSSISYLTSTKELQIKVIIDVTLCTCRWQKENIVQLLFSFSSYGNHLILTLPSSRQRKLNLVFPDISRTATTHLSFFHHQCFTHVCAASSKKCLQIPDLLPAYFPCSISSPILKCLRKSLWDSMDQIT